MIAPVVMAALAVAAPSWHGNPYKPPLRDSETAIVQHSYRGAPTVSGAGGGVRVAIYDPEDVAASEGMTA
jgi:hypothetical protein